MVLLNMHAYVFIYKIRLSLYVYVFFLQEGLMGRNDHQVCKSVAINLCDLERVEPCNHSKLQLENVNWEKKKQ